MSKLLSILLLLGSYVSFAQHYADKSYYLIDSLDLSEISQEDQQTIKTGLEGYHSAKTDTSRLHHLNYIIDNCWNEKVWVPYNRFMLQLATTALKSEKDIAIRRKLKLYKGGALNNEGFNQGRQGSNSGALELYEEALGYFIESEDRGAITQGLANLGVIYSREGNIPRALNYLNKSKEILEEINDTFGLGGVTINLAIIYRNNGDTTEAMELYRESLSYFLATDNEVGAASAYMDIGTMALFRNQFDDAKRYITKSLEIKKRKGDLYGQSHALNNLGILYQKLDSFELAISYYNQALEISESYGFRERTGYTLRELSNIHEEHGNLSLAKKYGEQAMEIANELNRPQFKHFAARQLSSVYQKTGNHEEALIYYKVHIHMRDSLKNEDATKAIAKQQAQAEYDKQKAIDEIAAKKEKKIQEEAQAKQNVILFAVLAGALLLAVFLFIVFKRLKISREQNRIIAEQKQEVESAHSQLEEKNQEILDSIAYAKRIQSAILPPSSVFATHLPNSFVLYKPKDIVAGDFYWLEHKNGKTMVAAADCTGHGVPGAMVSVICNNALNRSVREHGLTNPANILEKSREIVIAEFAKSDEEVKDGMDISLCAIEGMKLSYAGAHNPLWIIRKGEILEWKADKQPIGKFAYQKPFTEHEVDLEEGDLIYLFSDGYLDQFGGEKGKKLKAANFKKILLEIHQKPLNQQEMELGEKFEKWKGHLEQLDDVCVIGIKI